MKLYRIVSVAEYEDFKCCRSFRTAKNTLEAKQFFKSEAAIKEFYRDSTIQNLFPPYAYIIIVDIDESRLANIEIDAQELDRFEAITVFEADWPNFNKCINFTKEHDLRKYLYINR